MPSRTALRPGRLAFGLPVVALCALTFACEGRGTGGSSAVGAPRAGSSAAQEAGIVVDSAFWSTWGDGQAEVASYRLVQPRYGEARPGSAVAIFVTETFSESARVKADPGRHPPSDEVPVFKLNLVEDFQTGVYDYNLMTSAFVALAPRGSRAAGTPTKVSFSSQEWCGHVWHQLLFDDASIREASFSYFDGEADQARSLERKAGGLAEDTLLLWARGFASPQLAPGERREVPFLPSLKEARLLHEPLAWTTAVLERSAAPERVAVPAGSFDADVLTVTTPDGAWRRVYVERGGAGRVLKWERSDGLRAEMIAAKRMKYWEKNHVGDEALLRELGLPVAR